MKNNSRIRSILLIEDDELTATLYDMLLTEMGLFERVVVKTESEEALQFIKESLVKDCCPDLIFVDIKMLGLSGFELIEQINSNLKAEINFRSRIIVLTSSSFIKDIEKARELSVDDYVLKPLTKEKMYAVVEKFAVR